MDQDFPNRSRKLFPSYYSMGENGNLIINLIDLWLIKGVSFNGFCENSVVRKLFILKRKIVELEK
jgi:hypothetical protein